MNIGGFLPFTLSDYPGNAAAVIFLQGCNFRCPFCHNGSLIPIAPSDREAISKENLLEFLDRRRGDLDAVVISGGEPTIHDDLSGFLRRLRDMGFKIKLDTNGSRPDRILELISTGLIDAVAMDIKAPPEVYSRLAGVPVVAETILASIRMIASSGLMHEFRTTAVTELLSQADFDGIRAIIPDGSPYRIQEFRRENALDPALRNP
ncbi:anaerobic ribonucleoside-triphosphate reductase activating protein [bacterium]|nr:anaerobic ribonucleoside-triphosphate reductase activating protein [candidate division CSSED10-310 bacterium]